MRNLLVFGVLENILFLSLKNGGYYSITLMTIQGILIATKLIKENEVFMISLRIAILITTFFNSYLIQSPISYFTFGCASIIASKTPMSMIISAGGLIIMSQKYDAFTICEFSAFIIISIGYLLYINRKKVAQEVKLSASSYKEVEQMISPTPDKMDFNLFKKLLTGFPDGVVILNDVYQCQFSNLSFKKLLDENSVEQCVVKLLNMRNSIDGTQNNYQQLFLLLGKKIQSRCYSGDHLMVEKEYTKLISQREDCEEKPLSGNFAQSNTVSEEVAQIFKTIQDRHRISMENITSSSIKFYQEISIVCQEGTKLFQIILKPYKAASQSFILFIVRDTTHVNQIATLEQQNLNKSQMLYQVAHEFKTPLGLIQQNIAQLKKGIRDVDLVRDHLNPITLMTGQLLNLVSDLLDVAQLRAGRFNLTYVPIKIKDLFQEIIELMTIQTKEKGLYLRLQCAKDVPRVVRSDPNRIKQVVLNLISNSIKFTKKGGITVNLSMLNNMVQISVIDTGIGIISSDQNKLFLPFSKLDSYNPTGSGLGLNISNILALKLGEELKVHSEGQDKGATFSFKIKSQDYDSDFSCDGHNDDEGVLGKNIPIFNKCQCVEVLIVDDEPFNIRAIEVQTKIKLDKAYSAQEGLLKIENYKGCPTHHNYRVVLLDLEMPMIDGYQACQLIRERVDTQIIAFSAHSRSEIDLQSFDGYLSKPAKIEEFCEILNQF